MGQIHFFTTDLPLTADECQQIGQQIEAGLKLLGNNDDSVIICYGAEYKGSISKGLTSE